MKSSPFWLPILGMIVALLAIRPVGELLLRAEVLRRTGSRLSMERCQFNLLTGGLLIEGASVEPNADGEKGAVCQTSSMKIAKIWSQGSLDQLLYRKLSAPITVMDGVVIELSKADENQVPSVKPVSPIAGTRPLFFASQANAFPNELDQAFQNAQQGLQVDRSVYDRIERQMAELETRSLRVDNPLRDREAILVGQRSVASLQRDLIDLRNAMDRNRDSFQQESAAISYSMPADLPTLQTVEMGNSTDVAVFETEAMSLTEQLVCTTVAQMKPYLGLSAGLARHWLLNENGNVATLAKRSEERRNGNIRSVVTRGKNYRFGAMHEDEVRMNSIRMRGSAAIDAKQLPFSGQMRNIGSQSLQADDRPSFDLTFASPKKQTAEEMCWVAVNATIIPDRHGFRIRSQMVPAGSMIASASQGDWQLAAFGQEAIVNLVWLVHQSEWSLDIDIRSRECEVVVKRNTTTAPAIGTNLTPKFEPCYTSEDSVSLAKAKFQGSLKDGAPLQRSFIVESPFLAQLAESMVRQHKVAVELSGTMERQRADAERKQALTNYQAEIEKTHRQLVEAHDQLQARLQRYDSLVAEWLSDRGDLRFSREGSSADTR